MLVVNLNQAKAKLGDYIRRACAGERVVLCERNKPVAELRPVPYAGPQRPVTIGVLAGAFAVPDDFDAAIEELEVAMVGDPTG